jgi:hypothetical protein
MNRGVHHVCEVERDGGASRALPPILAGSARWADCAALSGAIEYLMVSDHSFRPLDAGGDIAARCPYLWATRP